MTNLEVNDTLEVLTGTPNENKSILKNKIKLNKSLSPSGCSVGVLAYCTDLTGTFGAQNTVDTLLADGRFSSVTLVDGDVVMPTAEDLLNNFNVVIAMTDNRCGFPIPQNIADSAASALVGFANMGGGVVLATFGFSTTLGFGSALFAPGLSPFQRVQGGNGPSNILVNLNTSQCSCLTDGVTEPLSSSFSNVVTLSSGAIPCLFYDIDSNLPFAAFNQKRNILAINTFPADESDNQQASYRRLIGNAVHCLCQKASRGINFWKIK